MSLLPEFMKAQSDNLPKIDSVAMFSFLGNNPDFMGAEIRGFKAQRSGRGEYGDNAIGYVQVKREADMCTVNAKVTPEHRVKNKAYTVVLQCNEAEEEILSVKCNDCAASLGGCKHAIALLMWLHRRSEEPAVTSVSSYWKKSKLSSVGTSIKFLKAKDLVMSSDALTPLNGSFLEKVINQSKLDKNDTVLSKYYCTMDKFLPLSVHNMLVNFFKSKIGTTADEFLEYAKSQIPAELCLEAMEKSVEQSESNLWFQLRYGRITASKAHEAAHCQTMDGSLVDVILGASTLKDTAAMVRGRQLEKIVCKEVEKQRDIKIKSCGFMTSPEYAIMGASPDGISNNYVIEVKCLSSEKASVNYVRNDTITSKFNVQMQLQMFFFEKKQGLFCVADPDFEATKNVNILVVDFDADLCKEGIEKSITFWKTAIFPLVTKHFV